MASPQNLHTKCLRYWRAAKQDGIELGKQSAEQHLWFKNFYNFKLHNIYFKNVYSLNAAYLRRGKNAPQLLRCPTNDQNCSTGAPSGKLWNIDLLLFHVWIAFGLGGIRKQPQISSSLPCAEGWSMLQPLVHTCWGSWVWQGGVDCSKAEGNGWASRQVCLFTSPPCGPHRSSFINHLSDCNRNFQL